MLRKVKGMQLGTFFCEMNKKKEEEDRGRWLRGPAVVNRNIWVAVF